MAFTVTEAGKAREYKILISQISGEIPSLTQLSSRVIGFNAADNLWFTKNYESTPAVITQITPSLLHPAPSGPVTNWLKFTGTVGTATDGTLFSTGSTWISHATAGQCAFKILASTAATAGDYATMRIRARADAADANATRGTMGIVGGNFSASANVNNHGNLIALQGYAQPNAFTNDGTANIVCGVYSCIDAGGSSAGRRWSAWFDTHETTKASGGDYLVRISHNGTIANDGVFTIYNGARMPVLFNFEDATGCLVDTGDAGSTKAGYLVVKTPAGTKKIQLVTT